MRALSFTLALSFGFVLLLFSRSNSQANVPSHRPAAAERKGPPLSNAAATPPLLEGLAEPPPSAEPPPLEGAPIERLALSGDEVAYVALPVGARDKRAIIVGVHGAGDRADWACSEWQATVASWAFVVCPQGMPHATSPSTFVWGSAEAIAKQTDRALAALRARYAAYIQEGPLLYGGWSQGATLAAKAIATRPGLYDRVALVEIGHTPLDASVVVASLRASGIRRAVVACESLKCRSFATDFGAAARRRGLRTEVVDVGLRHHWFDEPMFRALAPKLVWMVDDQPAFAGLGAAIDARWMTD